MPTYAFSTKSVSCEPAVDYAAAARTAFATGDYAGALPYLFCALTASPVDLDLHILHYQVTLRCGLYASATFSEAVLDTLGNDRWESIAQAARASLAANPQDEGAAIILAQATYFVSTPPEKASLIERLQALNPHNPYSLLLQASDLVSKTEDGSAAKRFMEQALNLAPHDPEILCWVADQYAFWQAIKDVPRALNLYEQALQLNPEMAAVFFGRGITHQEQGNLAAAQADLATALALTPFDYRIYNARARVYQAQGDDAAALADFQRVLALNPASYWALKGTAALGVQVNNLAARQAATLAFQSSHVLKPIDSQLTPGATVRLRLTGKEAGVIRATLAAGQPANFTVEAAAAETVFPAALLVAPDGGAVLFDHRTFESGPVVKLPLTAAAAGEYTLMVIFSGLGEQELIVSME